MIMLYFLRGKILTQGTGFVVVEVKDMGYKVFVSEELIQKNQPGDEAEFYVHQYVRENSLDLYGFNSEEKLRLFELLLSISGIGPKSSLAAVSITDVASFKDSISRGDPAFLTKVSGIGKKTAERVILELREKIVVLGASPGPGSEAEDKKFSSDELDALVSLGYSVAQAREALYKVDPEIKDSSERIRQALRHIK